MAEKKNKQPIDELEKNDKNKTELAERIARQSEKVASSYQRFEEGVFKIVRWFSTFLDEVLFNGRFGGLVALALAIIMYTAVNFNTLATVYTSSLKSSKEISDVTVTAKYNADTFEVSGLPALADVTVTGDAANVTNAANSSDGVIVADLEGLTEGEHEVRLVGEGYGDNVNVIVNPSTIIVTLKKKTTQQFTVSYDFVNREKMDPVYSPGTPEFEYTKVNVRASKETLNSIAFVKALIDVSGKTEDFEQDAKLVAYDVNGSPVNADISPETIRVKVPVSSPSKSVPIRVKLSGDLVEGTAIESITMDQQTVTIYGPETVLSEIDNVVVTLNAATLTKDSTILRPVVLPAGVSSSDITQITMNVTLGEAVEKVITDVPINVINNNNHYKASQPDNKTTTSVTVTGTQTNVDAVQADSIQVYINMKDAKPGLQTFALQVDQPEDGLLKYSLNETEYELNVLGETTSDDATGGNVNND